MQRRPHTTVPPVSAIGIYTKFSKRKSFQGKALSSNSAQMNWARNPVSVRLFGQE
jgi:hypothetical protein